MTTAVVVVTNTGGGGDAPAALGYAAIVWAICGLIAWRRLMRTMTDDYMDSWGDVAMTVCFSFFFAVMGGPLIPLGYTIKWAFVKLGMGPKAVLATVAGEKPEAKVKRLEGEARDRERRIAELERVTGVAAR